MENNAGLSGRESELQGSSRLGLTEPDDKANAINRGRTGGMLNPNVKLFCLRRPILLLLVTKAAFQNFLSA